MANEDWDEALRRIEKAREAGARELSLVGLRIDQVPEEIGALEGLWSLDLDNTQMSDLGALSGLSGLQDLFLNDTQVSDLRALSGLSGLQDLSLDGTQVRDLGALSGLRGLQDLSLTDTQVSDLGALGGLRGLQSLYLGGTRVSDLGALSGLSKLRVLTLAGTQVSDLRALSGLSGLQRLYLIGTQVRDLAPLRRLSALQELGLDSAPVSDLTPLVELTDLRVLDLDKTQVRDLRPLLSLPLLTQTAPKEADRAGLFVAETPAMDDPGVAKAMSKKLWEDRRLALLAHLQSLPDWPAPLPTDPGDDDGSGRPGTPDAVAAPLQVEVVDGVLQSTPSDSAEVAAPETQEAWQALREMLEDLAELLPGIHNAMPRLGKALARLENALGETPDACRPIRLGLHGKRVLALAELAPEALMDEAAAEVQAFAAGLEMHLEQFPEWRRYRDGSDAPESTAIDGLRADIAALADGMRNTPHVARDVPDTLEGLADLVEEVPEDPVARKGLVDSLRNTTSRLSRWALDEARDVVKKGWDGTKKTLATGLAVTVTGGVGLGVLKLLSGPLAALSTKEGFLWLHKVLEFLAPFL